MDLPVTLADIGVARTRIEGRVHRTPLLTSHTLGREIGLSGTAWLKAELFQRTGSFKARGALNKISPDASDALASRLRASTIPT